MTEKQQLFALEYIKDLNATRAYQVAYPKASYETAKRNGSLLLTHTDLKSFIDAKLDEIKSEKIADATEVMEYLTSVMRGQSKSEVVMLEGRGDGISEVVHVEKAPAEQEKLKAAELLAKRYGLLTDKVDLSASVELTEDWFTVEETKD